MKISKVFFCVMASLLYIPFFACKPNDQAPVTKIISTSLKLNADPPSPQKYNRDRKIKFTAIITLSDSTDLVGGNVQFKYKYNNNDQDDWKNDCGDVPVSPLPDGTLQAVCDIDLKGGRHIVTAVYTGFKNVFKPSNTDKIEYEIIQSPTNITSFTTTPDTETFTFGDTIQLKILMKKEQPNMPDFFSKDGQGGVAFAITQTSSSLLRFFQPAPQSIDICTNPNDVQAVKEPDGVTTTFTCAYKIIPNFITTEHSDGTAYSVKFSAHYLGNEYYKESPEITLEKTVNKISTSISNLHPKNSAYRSEGEPMILRGFISGEEQIVFSDAVLPTLMFDKSAPKNTPSCSWEKILIPSGSETSKTLKTDPTDLTNFHCTYTFADDDVTNCVKSNDDCHINVNYAGDSSHLSSPSAQFTIKLIKGHELNFTNVSVNPFVTVGEMMTINGTLATKIPGDQKPVLNNLQFHKIDQNNQTVIVPINDSFKCEEKSQISDGFNFICTYQTKSGDTSYKTFKIVYDDSQNKPYYKSTPNTLNTTINQIDASINSVAPDNLELNQATKITVKFGNISKYIPLSEKSIKISKSTDSYKSTLTCQTSQMSDDSFSCSYQITKDDFNFDKNLHQITFRASINGDPNYKDTAIPVSSAATTIAPISTNQVEISSTTPASGVPYTISFTGSRDVVSADLPYTKPQISFEKSFDNTNWTPANIDKCDTFPSTTDGSFKNCIYSIKQEDTSHEKIYFRAQFTDDQGYYQTSTSPVSDGIKTIQDCTISADPIDYQTCDLTKSCQKFKFSCGWPSYGSGTTLDFQLSITKMTPTGTFRFPDRPNSGNAYNENYFNCQRTDLGTAIQCYNFIPISDEFSIAGVLSWNQITVAKIADLRIKIKPLDTPSLNATTCGQIRGSSSQPTTIQRMFDCAMRVKNYAGYDNGSGQLITPDKPSDFKMAKSWYLVACPAPAAPDKPVDPNQCSWLSPELPDNTQLTSSLTVPDAWSDDSRPATAFRSSTIVHGIPQSTYTSALIKDLIGKRILWSGVLEKPNQSNAPPADRKDLNFFYTNGFSPRPVEKSSNNFGYPDLLNDAENYGAYTGFLTLPQSPNAKCTNNGTTPWWDGAPWTPECWENQAIFEWRSTQFPINWHNKNQAYANTICAPYEGQPNEKQKCMSMIGTNRGDSPSNFWQDVKNNFAAKAKTGTTPQEKEQFKQYAYTDVCQRRNWGSKFAETFDRALIAPGAYGVWQVPSYPILLTLTGKSSSDGDQNCANSSNKEEAMTRCLVNNITNPIIKQQLNIAGFYATTPTIPGFDKNAFLWSSDIIMDQYLSSGGDCHNKKCLWTAFAFHDGAVMALGMTASVDVRCISLFW